MYNNTLLPWILEPQAMQYLPSDRPLAVLRQIMSFNKKRRVPSIISLVF